MTGNGSARWVALGALVGSLACASNTARTSDDTGAAPSSGTTTTDNGGATGTTTDKGATRQGGVNTGDTAGTQVSQDTATGRPPTRIHTDSAGVAEPTTVNPPSQTDTTGQFRYNDSVGASSTAIDSARRRSTARDSMRSRPTTRDSSRTQGP